ncbi:MAG: DUF3829 domain-containing protein [Bradyrhizobium sp.]
MRASLSRQGLGSIAGFLALGAATIGPMLPIGSAAAQGLPAAVEKANLYIEVAKGTERAVDSWERYASWVNMKTGPTGKERYISYGMYELHDLAGLLKEARAAAARKPSAPALDATIPRYLDAYEALAPVMNQANDYYEQRKYRTDNAAGGKALHARMVPLANAFLTQRDAMMKELRPFIREAEQQELAAIEAREGRSLAWQVAQVMHAANVMVDVFPRARPVVMSSDEIDQKMMAIGPNTPGEKLDEIIAGVKPPATPAVDINRFDAALKGYAAAVETFDRFAEAKAGTKSAELEDFKSLPRRLLDGLRAMREPLAKSQGRKADGAGRIAEIYFAMLSNGSSISGSRLRFLE